MNAGRLPLSCDTAPAERIERAETQIIAPPGRPCGRALLTGRGYRLTTFENVLGLALAGEPEGSRHRGIEARLGCDVAVVTTVPGSKSQQNAQRQGFDLLYTRAILVKQPRSAAGPHWPSAV